MASPPKPAEFADVERRTLRGFPRRLVRGFLYGICWLVLGMRLEHLDRVPARGGILAVSNHLHNADPILTAIAFPRSIHYMAKKELFSIPIVRSLIPLAGVFPVDRGRPDRWAIRRAEAALRQGVAVGMFPEGTRSPTRALRDAHAGAGLLALTTGAPFMPVVVTGTERLPFNGKRGREQANAPMPNPGHRGVRILFGEPLVIPREIDGRRVSAAEATEIMMVEIARLLPPDYRGVYAEPLAREAVRRAMPWTP